MSARDVMELAWFAQAHIRHDGARVRGESRTRRTRKRDGAYGAAAGWAGQGPENQMRGREDFHIWTDNQARLSNPIFSEGARWRGWLLALPPCPGLPSKLLQVVSPDPHLDLPSAFSFRASSPPSCRQRPRSFQRVIPTMVSALWKACSEGHLDSVADLLKEATPVDIEVKGKPLPRLPHFSPPALLFLVRVLY